MQLKESGIQVPLTKNLKLAGTWNPESTVWNPESKTVLDYPRRRGDCLKWVVKFCIYSEKAKWFLIRGRIQD